MARYDRRLLVPYLQDVCSVELLCERAARDVAACRATLNAARKQEGRKADYVQEPSLLSMLSMHLVGWAIVAILFIVVAANGSGLAILLFILVGGTILGASLATIWKVPGEYAYEKRKYESYLAEQAGYDREKAHYREIANIQEKKIALLNKRLNSVQQLRQQVYSVNIIPNKYRNRHAAYYLFDYFSSCTEDDLGRVI